MREDDNTKQVTDDSGTGLGHAEESTIKTSRRQSLKHLAAGSTLVGGVVIGATWHKPLVKSVVLPAHAQASQSPPTCTGTGVSGSQTFTSDGTFTIPDCVYQLDVVVNGGGGGGGYYPLYTGGNGEQLTAQFAVMPGTSYPVTIGYGGGGSLFLGGTGGYGGTGHSDGEDGVNQFFTGGGGGSSHFNGIEASGGGGGYYGGGDGGGPNGGAGGTGFGTDGAGGDAGNGAGASGGATGANGTNGSVIISY